jgi:predicted RNA binding protein YcfA (HicA-like mRNA interferase family)
MLSYSKVEKELKNFKNVHFKYLLKLCIKLFGSPRIKGSHHIFKMPWEGNPRINLQRDGKMVKPYQVKQVIAAIKKLEESKR